MKAVRACGSAQALLDLGDVDGACNRAYYAMFDAARAGLLVSGAPVPPEIGKTHRGLIGVFSLHLVKHGPISRELGRMLKRAEEIRIVADYKASSVELADARNMVEQVHRFVAAICAQFLPAQRRSAPSGIRAASVRLSEKSYRERSLHGGRSSGALRP